MEKEELEVDIQNIKDAINKLVQAMNDIGDIDGTDEQYQDLERIYDELDNERINLELALEQIEEDNGFEENKEQWKKEKEEQVEEFIKNRI